MFKKKDPPPKPPKQFPPVLDWRPSVLQPLDQIVDRVRYYTDGKRDFAVFQCGTVAILPAGLSEPDAALHAKAALHNVFHAHPDMCPLNMDDGNVLVRYNHDVLTVVLKSIASQHWSEIEREHQRALATDEVLITPMGPNKFDEFGMKALFGRCFMFMDAQAPTVVRVERSVA
ncbi:hypothetical protein C7S18_06220 [Ahniella affigens]|uniref:Uncharacterized protein n=2 Tax=Ahniella affigens TaxID=2021234 RepID=A0A2P1PPP9_9GAMM|nr:hypothetical protein C7S18_06220 [Ahniella affigens]